MKKLIKLITMTKLLIFATFFLAVEAKFRFERPSRVVEIKHGKLQGTLIELPIVPTSTGPPSGASDADISFEDDAHEPQVEVFRGIPFAQPPIGSLRFMPPVTVTPWRETRAATVFGPVCPQLLPDTRNETLALTTMGRGRFRALRSLKPMLANQSEDCLYLNVYAPVKGSRNEQQGLEPKPVILFIHGDSYEWGSGNIYDGSIFAAVGQVVVVTLNYRLGILGFLNANTDGKSRNPANLGILDQIAALHWVQENIAQFGGDPKNVTLMGHGTGAACVHFLMTSEALPEGMLFHRVILMSGSALSPWAVVHDTTSTTKQVAEAFNCSLDGGFTSGGRHQTLLQCLRSVPHYQLMRFRPTPPPGSGSQFRPIWGPSYDGVVVHSFRNRMRDYLERMARYELLFGVATADALFSLNDKQLEYGIESEGRNRIISDFVSANYELHQREVFSAIVTEYTDWQNPTRHPVNIRDQTLEALSDALYVAPVIETGDYHSSLNAKSWFYVFEYQTKNSFFKQRQGCVHGEDLHYVFGTPLLASDPRNANNFTRTEALLSRKVIHFWSNFASKGDPNADKKSSGHQVLQWERYDPKYKKYLLIGLKLRMRDHYRSQKMALWLNLVPDLQSAAAASYGRGAGKKDPPSNSISGEGGSSDMYEYRLYSELLPFVPKLKNVEVTSDETTPASSEVLDNFRSNRTSAIHDGSKNNLDAAVRTSMDGKGGKNETNSINKDTQDTFSNYSTALSVTIAIGCSLLVLNVLIFTAVYYQRERNREGGNKLETNLAISSAKQQQQQQQQNSQYQQSNLRDSQRQRMSSISQYIERRPSDPNCLQQAGSPTFESPLDKNVMAGSGRRSLPEMQGGGSIIGPGTATTTISIGGNQMMPRKSALKQGSGLHKGCSNGASTFRGGVPGGPQMQSSSQAHLPPPEFADLPSPSELRTTQPVLEFISSSDHQPLLVGSSSSFRSLPRRCATPTQQQQVPININTQGPMPMPKGGHQTLPLKSNLKKSGGNNGSQKLQWHEPNDGSGITRASLEELRV